ncbi:hypothetical protein BDR06DRAFT_967460 [Suillus hirtellus]|nr:hypothetical protein BDR06DRAFT_967460 [Suillus hirtellus]
MHAWASSQVISWALGYKDLYVHRMTAAKYMEDSKEWTSEWMQTAVDKRTNKEIKENQLAFYHAYEYNASQKMACAKCFTHIICPCLSSPGLGSTMTEVDISTIDPPLLSLISMKHVKSNENWSLFCPNEVPGLHKVHGEEFEALYETYEIEGHAQTVIPAQKLWYAILEAQIETGGKLNQKNLGTIKLSNLCTEIIEYSLLEETTVCNLASLALPTFILNSKYDFQKLHDVAKVITCNLNHIINVNMCHRPIGLGVQGLADAFMILHLPFDSLEARQLNLQIFETIYHAGLEASCEEAERNRSYETFRDSPANLSQLQYDLWSVTSSDLWDWTSLKEKIAQTGLWNSLLVAPMPTASTSQILSFNECFEPYTRDLVDCGLWNDEMKNMIIAHNGSITNIPSIPYDIKAIYKTIWEISQRKVIDFTADCGVFICQSQSLNIHLQLHTVGQLTSMYFYGWKKGLKTGMYYLHTCLVAQAIQFTINQSMLKAAKVQQSKSSKAATGIPTPSASPLPFHQVPPPSNLNDNGVAPSLSGLHCYDCSLNQTTQFSQLQAMGQPKPGAS